MTAPRKAAPKKTTAKSARSPIAASFSVDNNATFVSDDKTPVDLPTPGNITDEELSPPEMPKRATPKGALEKKLTDTYSTVGVMVGMFDAYCGHTIVDNADAMAQSMAEWANEDPKVRAALERMMVVGAFGKVLAAHAPVIMAIGSHHVPAVRNALYGKPEPTTDAGTTPAADDYGNPVANAA